MMATSNVHQRDRGGRLTSSLVVRLENLLRVLAVWESREIVRKAVPAVSCVNYPTERYTTERGQERWQERAISSYEINDVDNHFNEPPDFFERYIDSSKRDLVIRDVTAPDGRWFDSSWANHRSS